MALQKKHYTIKLISILEVNGKFIKKTTKNTNISKAQTDFYQNLYSENLNEQNDNYHNSLNDFLNNNEIPKLNIDEKTFCDKPIDEADILKSIKNLPSGKTPGSDGLPDDFYNFSGVISKDHLPNVLYMLWKRVNSQLYRKEV